MSHILLTVTGLERSVLWYERVLGVTRREEVHDVYDTGHDIVVLIHADTDLAINLHRHGGNDGRRFNERQTGLDHVSLLVDSRQELGAWQAHLDRLGVEHTAIADEEYGSVLVFRDPDNIQLELFVNPP